MDLVKYLDKGIDRIFGTKHERDIKKMQPVIAAINAKEPEVQALSDEQLKEQFGALKTEVQEAVEG